MDRQCKKCGAEYLFPEAPDDAPCPWCDLTRLREELKAERCKAITAAIDRDKAEARAGKAEEDTARYFAIIKEALEYPYDSKAMVDVLDIEIDEAKGE